MDKLFGFLTRWRRTPEPSREPNTAAATMGVVTSRSQAASARAQASSSGRSQAASAAGANAPSEKAAATTRASSKKRATTQLATAKELQDLDPDKLKGLHYSELNGIPAEELKKLDPGFISTLNDTIRFYIENTIAMAEKDATIAELDTELAELDAQIAHRAKIIAEKDAQIARLREGAQLFQEIYRDLKRIREEARSQREDKDDSNRSELQNTMETALDTVLGTTTEEMSAKGEVNDGMPHTVVSDIIKDKPITGVKAQPAWGVEHGWASSSSDPSTNSHSSWITFLGEHVEPWQDCDFMAFLNQANPAFVKCFVSRDVEGVTVKKLDGSFLAGLLQEVSIEQKVMVEEMLQRGVWGVLEQLTDELDFPYHIQAHQGKAAVAARIAVAPHLKGTMKPDRIIITKTKSSQGSKGRYRVWGSQKEEEHLRDSHEEAQKCKNLFGMLAVEIKPDYVCPLPFDLGHSKRNDAVGAGFVNYLKSGDVSIEDKKKNNPISQVGSYAMALGVKNVAVCTLNTMTFGELQVLEEQGDDGSVGTVHHMRITRKFDWTEANTGLVDAEGKSLSHWEVLVRYLLATMSSTYLDRIPDTFKEKAKAKDAQNGKKKQNPYDDHHSEDEGESDHDEGFSSDACTKFGRLYWEELWDPRRFAIPATHSLAEEFTQEKLPGDADLLGHSRVGPSYRKRIRGLDVMVKVALVHDETRGKNDPTFEDIMEELVHEAKIYSRLLLLQGAYVPRFVWQGAVIEDMIGAVVTEYAGEPMNESNVPPDLVVRALEALDAIHAAGVIHNDLTPYSILLGDHGEVRIIDFGFSKVHGEDLSDVEFENQKESERSEFENMLKEFAAVGSGADLSVGD